MESTKHFTIGFILGFIFNILGFGILNNMKQKNKKKNGFGAGCIVSFIFYIFFCFSVMAYLSQVQTQKHNYAKSHKNSTKKFHASSFSSFLNAYLTKGKNNIKSVLFFWRKKSVSKSKRASKREKEIQKLKKKRLHKISKLRRSFKSRYNFSL